MKKVLIMLTVLMLLSACGAESDAAREASEASENQVTLTEQDQAPVVEADTADKTQDQTAPVAETTPAKKSDPEPPKEVFPLATFIELGAESCIPCRMMQPVMKEIQDEYQGLVKVIFIDLYKERNAAQKYNVRVMPTQVFLDMNGKEFFRHEGFYPKADIEKMLAEKIGITKPKKN